MKISLSRLTLVAALFAVASCTMSHQQANSAGQHVAKHPEMTSSTLASNAEYSQGPVSGSSGMRTAMMDDIDQSKLSHALDKGAGKSTHWMNANSGVAFTVTPGKISAINGNPYCREYTVTTDHGNSSYQSKGKACVTNGVWEIV